MGHSVGLGGGPFLYALRFATFVPMGFLLLQTLLKRLIGSVRRRIESFGPVHGGVVCPRHDGFIALVLIYVALVHGRFVAGLFLAIHEGFVVVVGLDRERTARHFLAGL